MGNEKVLGLLLLLAAPISLWFTVPRYIEGIYYDSQPGLPDQNPPEFSKPPMREAN